MAEHLDTILRLVAEGKLSAADAEPLLAALSRPAAAPTRPSASPSHARHDPDDETSEWTFATPPTPPTPVTPPTPPTPPAPPLPARVPDTPAPPRGLADAKRRLRIEVVEGGRRVVNLRIPLSFASVAAEFVPGLSSADAERIREAIRSGLIGPILEVEGDDGDRVVIATE